jgi:hypothetical protein
VLRGLKLEGTVIIKRNIEKYIGLELKDPCMMRETSTYNNRSTAAIAING